MGHREAARPDRDGMLGANRRHSKGYGEDLQRRRPPESRDAQTARDPFSVASIAVGFGFVRAGFAHADVRGLLVR